MGKTIISILILILYLSMFPMYGSCSSDINVKYGFWPFYVDSSSYQPNWDGLTHVIYYFWWVNSDGTLTPAETWKDTFTPVNNEAHQNGKKVIIGIFSNDPSVIDNVIANHKTEFANNILNLVQSTDADGVNLDFEFPSDTNTITYTSNVPIFEKFMSTLYTTLKTANSDYQISLCGGAYGKYITSYNNSNLKQYMDSIILMGYDYNYLYSGPNSPCNDSTRYDIVDSVNDLSKYFNRSQIVLAMPFYCYDVTTRSDISGTLVTERNSIDIKDAMSKSKSHYTLWDSNSNTPWYRYNTGDTWHQVWYDNSQSFLYKKKYAKSAKLGGIGYYPLGSEPKEIWNTFL